MSNRAILLLVFGLVSFTAWAQSDSTATRSTWFVSIHTGVLAGKTGTGSSVSATLAQGVRYDRVSLGAGLGYDVYPEWKLLPVFAAVSYDLIRRRNHAFYVQFDAGYSKAWTSVAEEFQRQFESDGGYFYHPFVGYRAHHGKVTIYFSAGYKFQGISYGQTLAWIPWSSWTQPATSMSVERNMERLSIQMGIGLR